VVAVSDTRERVLAHIERMPGVHFRQLGRDLDLATGQVQYHLRRLERAERIVTEEVDGRTHYFPPTYDDRERRALAVVRRETARDVLAYLVVDAPACPQAVAVDIDIARSTLEWHLDRLIAVDLVEKRRDERGRVTLLLADEDLVAGLLGYIEPSLPERLVDRFSRLVDGLLYE